MSLYRLINLAKRAGDRLIVHDPANGNDVVIMDIDSYESLLDQAGYPDENSFDDLNDKYTDNAQDINNQDFVTADTSQNLDEDYESNFSDLSASENPVNISASDYPDSENNNFVPEKKAGASMRPIPHWSSASDILNSKYNNFVQKPKPSDDAIKMEKVPYDIPFVPNEDEFEFDEEKLDDEPVFLEEPI
jgi:hypothetical protein